MRSGQKICLPAELDPSALINISEIGSEWCKFLDPKTSTVHDCRAYAEALDAEARRGCDYDD